MRGTAVLCVVALASCSTTYHISVDGYAIRKKKRELEYTGKAYAQRREGDDTWHTGVIVDAKEKHEPWQKMWAQVADDNGFAPIFAYRTDAGQAQGRGTCFKPLSKLKPYVEESSQEWKDLIATLNERARKAHEAAAERQRQEQAAAAERERQAAKARERTRAVRT